MKYSCEMLCFVVCFVLVGGSASADGSIPSEYFGTTFIGRSRHRYRRPRKRCKGYWPYLEMQPGVYSWSNLDAWVALTERLGGAYYSFKAIPAWAAGDQSACVPSSVSGNDILKVIRQMNHLLLAVLCACCWPLGSGGPAFADGVIPPEYFGMTHIDRSSATRDNTGALGKGTFVAWPYIQPRPDSFVWSNLDAWISTAESLGVDFLYSFKAIPAWAALDQSTCEPTGVAGISRCSSMPRDIGLFDNFVTTLVTRYKGRIKFYELWNEPEYDSKISPVQMVELTNHAHDIIRRIDPNARIVSPSLNGRYPEYAERYFSAGGTRDVDIVSIHTYTGMQTNYPETLDRNYIGPGALVAPLLPVLRKYELDSKPLWSTEGAWSDRPNSLPNANDQAAFVARALLLHWSTGFSRFYWYAYDHSTVGTLLNTAAGRAYLATKRRMVGATMVRPCRKDRSEVWSCELRTPRNQLILVAWSLSEGVQFGVGSTKSVTDVTGASVQIKDRVIELGRSPIFLEE